MSENVNTAAVAGADAGAEAQQVTDQLSEIVCRIGSIAKLDPEQNFFDAGLSSVQALDLLIEIETVFGVSLPDEEFAKARSVRALQGLVTAAKGGVPG